MMVPLALRVESDCKGNYTGAVRPTHLLVTAGLACGPVGGWFTRLQKTLCCRGPFTLSGPSRCFASLEGLNIAFSQRVAKLK